MLERLIAGLSLGSRWGVWFGGTLIFLGAIVVSIDVLLRKLLGTSLGGADELSGYALAIGSAWAFAFALLERANVRVDALYQHLPQALRAQLDLLALLSLAAFVWIVTWFAWDVAATSAMRGALSNTQLKTPLWIPQGLWFLGLFFFSLTLLSLILRTAQACLRSDYTWIQSKVGARSIEEDAADEASYSQQIDIPGASNGRPA